MPYGKQFEKRVRKAFEKQVGISIDRLYDPTAGYFGIRNICDFIVYKKPYQLYLECKTRDQNTLHFKSGITESQWEGLLEKSKIDGVIAGILVWYRHRDITAFVPIQELERLRKCGRKSLHVLHIEENSVDYVLFPGTKKRVYFEYDGAKFMENLFEKIVEGVKL